MKKMMFGLIVGLLAVGAVEARGGHSGGGYYGSSNSSSRTNSNSGGYNYGTGSNPNSSRVDGYTKQNGTYVNPYERTTQNNTQRDNYETRGNYNPWTGKTGTRTPQK